MEWKSLSLKSKLEEVEKFDDHLPIKLQNQKIGSNKCVRWLAAIVWSAGNVSPVHTINCCPAKLSNCLEPPSIGIYMPTTMTLQMALFQLSDWTQGVKTSDFAFAWQAFCQQGMANS